MLLDSIYVFLIVRMDGGGGGGGEREEWRKKAILFPIQSMQSLGFSLCLIITHFTFSPQDIRNQHRYRQQRKQELKRLSETMEKLSRKSKFYEDQMNYYHQYIKACLDQLAKTGAKTSGRVRRGTGEDGSGFKKQSVKYNAHKLHEKGVILEIEGLPNHQ